MPRTPRQQGIDPGMSPAAAEAMSRAMGRPGMAQDLGDAAFYGSPLSSIFGTLGAVDEHDRWRMEMERRAQEAEAQRQAQRQNLLEQLLFKRQQDEQELGFKGWAKQGDWDTERDKSKAFAQMMADRTQAGLESRLAQAQLAASSAERRANVSAAAKTSAAQTGAEARQRAAQTYADAKIQAAGMKKPQGIFRSLPDGAKLMVFQKILAHPKVAGDQAKALMYLKMIDQGGDETGSSPLTAMLGG